MLIQLARSGLIQSGSANDLDALRATFDRLHCVTLHRFLEPELLAFVHREIARAQFDERIHAALTPPAVDLCMRQNNALVLLQCVLLGDPRLFSFVEALAGCGPIRSFDGGVYRMLPGAAHHDSWHSDLSDERRIAVSVNLSDGVYEGGVLSIRDETTGRIVHEVANTGPGDAILFRLSNTLKHRVSQVTGRVAKTAFAGWFRSAAAPNPVLDRHSAAAIG